MTSRMRIIEAASWLCGAAAVSFVVWMVGSVIK